MVETDLISCLRCSSAEQEDYLKKLVKNPDYVRNNKQFTDTAKQLRFLISRQWNSWYPSYFNSEGGCYAITTRDPESDPRKNNGVIVIDPGIGFMVSLRKYFHIEPQDIKQIIVSHFHPDHMAGLIEFATLSYESEFPCDVYLNSTSYSFFRAFQGKYLHIHEIKPGQVKRLFRYDYRSSAFPNKVTTESAYLKIVDTHHSEIGHRHNSLGFIIDFNMSLNGNSDKKYSQKIGIMGDTDGNKQYIPEYLDKFSDVDILVLHLGSINSKKYEIGDAHLYLDGVDELLNRWNSSGQEKPPKLFLLSEFGLELGTTNDIGNLLSPLLESHGFSLFLYQGASLLTESKKTDIEVGAFLIDKIWANLRQQIKTGIADEQLDEIICTLALFSFSICRKYSFDVLNTKNSDSSAILKEHLKNEISHLFSKVIDSKKIENPDEYLNQIKVISEILQPKCNELLQKIPNLTDGTKRKEDIGNLYLDFYRHALFHDVFLNVSEKKVYRNRVNSHIDKNGVPSILDLQKRNDLISDIDEKNKKIGELTIPEIFHLADIVFSALSELPPYEKKPRPPQKPQSEVILQDLTQYLSKYTIPTYCANAGSYVQLFENVYFDDKRVTFNFVKR